MFDKNMIEKAQRFNDIKVSKGYEPINDRIAEFNL